MRILGIETSCDETAVAIVRDGCEIESNVIASQTDLHARYGGVVPEQASRAHLGAIVPALETAFSEACVDCHRPTLGHGACTPRPHRCTSRGTFVAGGRFQGTWGILGRLGP